MSGQGVSNAYQPPRNAISAFWSPPPNLLPQYSVAGGATPPWAPRRGRRSPGIHSRLVRAVFVPIWEQSYAVPTGLLRGVVPSQHRHVSIEDAGAGGGWWGWVAALRLWRARPRSGSAGNQGSLKHPFFYPPKKDTNNALPRAAFSRLWSPSCRPSARVRRGGPVAMINVLHGRHVGVVPVARRSSRLVPLPWVAPQPRALVQLVHLLHALGGGPSSHAWAKHGRPASPRRARPTGRVPLRSQAVRLSLYWCATRGRARVRVRARRVARVAHAETAWVRPGAEPLPCVSPRRSVADLQACAHPTPTLTLTLTDAFRAVITGARPCTVG